MSDDLDRKQITVDFLDRYKFRIAEQIAAQKDSSNRTKFLSWVDAVIEAVKEVPTN